jgi:hypothetical protein
VRQGEGARDIPSLLLTEGGPGDALLRRLRLAPLGRHAARTAIALAAVTWVPLLVFSAIEGLAVGGAAIPFLYDLAAHVRFLVAVPVLLLAEIPIGLRLRQVAAHFVEAGLVRGEEEGRFAAIIRDTLRMRDSRVAELIVLGAAYLMTYGMLTSVSFQGGSTWYLPHPDRGLTPVGYWYAFVALPVFQFLLYRWLYRMLVWARFLRRVSRLDLQLTPTHPDGAAGLGFVGKGCIPFGALLFATSAVVASAVASRVLFGGADLQRFQTVYGALLVLALAVFAGPVLVFAPTLIRVKQRGLVQYGTLASRYTQGFERKWVKGVDASGEPLLGTADIQSLADLGNSYELIRKMRILPLEARDFVAMVIPGVIPALPLAATVMPIADIMKSLLHLLV